MSYESKMLQQLAMPTRKEVEQALLRALLKHNGVIKEFRFGEEIVDEIAGEFGLSKDQRFRLFGNDISRTKSRFFTKQRRNLSPSQCDSLAQGKHFSPTMPVT